MNSFPRAFWENHERNTFTFNYFYPENLHRMNAALTGAWWHINQLYNTLIYFIGQHKTGCDNPPMQKFGSFPYCIKRNFELCMGYARCAVEY